jgi:hypothetical protein
VCADRGEFLMALCLGAAQRAAPVAQPDRPRRRIHLGETGAHLVLETSAASVDRGAVPDVVVSLALCREVVHGCHPLAWADAWPERQDVSLAVRCAQPELQPRDELWKVECRRPEMVAAKQRVCEQPVLLEPMELRGERARRGEWA